MYRRTSVFHPFGYTARAPRAASEFVYDQPDDEALEAAKIAIHTELAPLVGFPSANAEQLREGLLKNPESISWTTESDSLAYDAATQTWKEASSLSLDSHITRIFCIPVTN